MLFIVYHCKFNSININHKTNTQILYDFSCIIQGRLDEVPSVIAFQPIYEQQGTLLTIVRMIQNINLTYIKYFIIIYVFIQNFM